MSLTPICVNADGADDLWLEELDDPEVKQWVESRNKATLAKFGESDVYQRTLNESLSIYQSKDRVPYVREKFGQYYNFWRDANNLKGILRRTSKDEYVKDSPSWETVIDFDVLARCEGKDYTYAGMECLLPEQRHCLIKLASGGNRKIEYREFDLKTNAFIPKGFHSKPSISSATWINKDEILIATDFGEGSMSESNYPLKAKRWKRGTSLKDAELIYESQSGSTGVFMSEVLYKGTQIPTMEEDYNRWSYDVTLLIGGETKKLLKPKSADFLGFFKGNVFLQLRAPLKIGKVTYNSGAVLYADYSKVKGLKDFSAYNLFIENDDKRVISSIEFTKNAILVNWTVDVTNKLSVYHYNGKGFEEKSVQHPENGTIWLGYPSQSSNEIMFTFENLITPNTLYRMDDKTLESSPVKHQSNYFDNTNLTVSQYFATSKDGTNVPYFIVKPNSFKFDGTTPTLLKAYGGFARSSIPYYDAALGKRWMEKGFVYVLANVRGGAEYGPEWHETVKRRNKHKSFEDFEAVARDLIQKEITQPSKLAITGTSNGGLLITASMIRHPELYGAVIGRAPVLDMIRYAQLAGGSAWKEEYGDPEDPSDREYLAAYSPYHNVKTDKQYPPVFFTTSTNDDVVHPSHARRMSQRMQSMGHKAYLFENPVGGHRGAADFAEKAHIESLIESFLHQTIVEPAEADRQ